jgi:hypothetical protein
MYDDKTGQPTFQGILVIAALILALFAFEVAEPGKKNSSSNVQEKRKLLPLSRRSGLHCDL